MPGDALSDVRYLVGFDGPAFIIGFKLMSMIHNEVYVTLEPINLKFTKSQLRELREKLDEFDYNFFCQTDSIAGQRFAEFFGFKQTRYAWGRAHLTRGQK